jgi:hypothetical protein
MCMGLVGRVTERHEHAQLRRNSMFLVASSCAGLGISCMCVQYGKTDCAIITCLLYT